MKKFVIPLIAFILLLVGLASALTVTISSPSADTLIHGATNTITATVTVEVDENVSAVYYEYRNTTSEIWYLLGVNRTENLTSYTLNFDTSTYADTTDGYLNVTASNNTGITADQVNVSSALVAIDIDNTAPSTPTLTLDKTKIRVGDQHGIYAECSGSTDTVDSSLTYLFTLTKPDDSTVTQSGNTWKIKGVNINMPNPTGGYSLQCSVTDDVPNSTTTSTTFKVFSEKEDIDIVTEEEEKEEVVDTSTTNTILIVTIIIIIIVVVIIYAITQLKGKKKKK